METTASNLNQITAIVARRASDKVIGSKGVIPWYIPEDLRFFRNTTLQGGSRNICIMGRKTYESLGASTLPQRTIYVVSSSLKVEKDVTEDQVQVFPTPRDALLRAMTVQKSVKIFICGGENIYRELVPYCSKVYLTEVYRPGDGLGDAFFPTEFLNGFRLREKSEMQYSTNQGFPFETHIYTKVHQEDPYLELCKTIIEEGEVKEDRTGTGTISYFGPQLTYDLSTGEFPLLTTKRVFWKGVVEELLWFIRGETDANLLSQKGVKIWDGNTTREFLDNRGLGGYEVGDIGPGYGFQWRHWGAEYNGIREFKGEKGGIDQLSEAVRQIRETPESRRIIVSAWNVSDLTKMALPPCHLLFQFNVSAGGNFLDLKMYQRSADWFLGVPFNIASYALLLKMVCHLTGKKPRLLILTFGDAHVYKTHVEQIKEQISREPYPFPRLEIEDREQRELEDFIFEDFKLIDYKCHPTIKAEMAV